MAKLTTKARKDLPASKFAGPDRGYPVPDKSHAVNAKARASEMANRGRISGAAERSIDRKADAVIERMSKHKAPK
jgi:hypothetical protein